MEFHHAIAWAMFLAVVLILLAIDLFVLHRKPHAIQFKEALFGAMVPISCALLFTVAVYFGYQTHFLDLGLLPENIADTSNARFFPTTGSEAALLYITGYLVELSLSADNVFLFVVLMTNFRVPREYQHRVLFWGILGALVMRGLMIWAGSELLTKYHWIIYVFGAFLVYTSVKLLISGDEPKDPGNNLAVRLVRRVLPFHDDYDGKNFFTRINGRWVATTLFLVLICIEFTDLVFALDSIPAIFGITMDPFIVFTSNVFAILGLRSMYFLLAGIMDKFHLLKYGLSVVLGFVGVKMLLPGMGQLYARWDGGTHDWHVPNLLSLVVIGAALTVAIILSLVFPARKHHDNPLDEPSGPAHGEPSPADAPNIVEAVNSPDRSN